MKSKEKTGVLKHKDFILIPSEHCTDRFDLFRASTNKKTGKDTKILIGYAYRLDEACNTIIGMQLAERTDIGEIKTYVSEYKKAVKELQGILA